MSREAGATGVVEGEPAQMTAGHAQGTRWRAATRGWLAGLAVVGAASGAGASDWSAGGAFLPLGHGARAHGLGGAVIAMGRDDASAYWNPANLAWIEPKSSVTLMHAALFPEVDNGYQTVSFGMPRGPRLGEPEQRLRPCQWGFGAFVGHLGLGFEAGDWTENRLQLAAAYALSNYASLGLSARFMWLTNDFEGGNAHGGGFDAGLSLLLTDALTVALVVRDAYSEVQYDTKRSEILAPGFELGIDYRWRTLEVEADGTGREGGLQRTALGCEWRPHGEWIAVRGGWTAIRAGESRSYPSAGVGLRTRGLVVDYGAAFDNADATGIGQRVSLQLVF